MAVQQPVTIDEFQSFVRRPENAERIFELIGGEIVEVSPSFTPSTYAAEILRLVGNWVASQKPRPGHITGADGGYVMPDGQKFNPDVGYISRARLPQKPKPGGEAPLPPDFAVEVISPSDLQHYKQRIETKRDAYLAAKIPLLWYVYPERWEVVVYAYGEYVRTVDIDGVLDGGDVFPGLTLAVRDIFIE